MGETVKTKTKRTGWMGTATVTTKYVGARHTKGWERTDEDEEGLTARPIDPYFEYEDKQALLRTTIETTDNEDRDKGAGS